MSSCSGNRPVLLGWPERRRVLAARDRTRRDRETSYMAESRDAIGAGDRDAAIWRAAAMTGWRWSSCARSPATTATLVLNVRNRTRCRASRRTR